MECSLLTLSEKELLRLQHQFSSAQPFKHIVLSDLFANDVALDILKTVSEQELFEKNADLFHFLQSQDFSSLSNEKILLLRSFFCSPKFMNVLETITGFSFKPGFVDMHATLYRDTDYLLCHDDELEGRKIAFMYYLSDLNKGEGGTLNLYNSDEGDPATVAKRIVPLFNTLVLFEMSPISFHAVSEVIADTQRLAIGGWFYAKD